jgi:putative NADPH-quinone reductase
MSRRVCIIQGHPSQGEMHFCHALAKAYGDGAIVAGHQVKSIAVAELDFPLLRSKRDWDNGEVPPAIAGAQQDIAWSQHLVIIHPLWIGMMPALLKGFLEQVYRPGFAVSRGSDGQWAKLLKGRSARIIVTMGMPALIYRWYFGAHSLKNLKQNLALTGIKPCRHTLIGSVEAMADAKRSEWLASVRALGACGA